MKDVKYTKKQERVSHFIRLVRGISPQWIRFAAMNRSCFRFAMLLKDRFPEAVLYGKPEHALVKIAGKYWDIYGEHIQAKNGKVKKMSAFEIETISSCYFDEGFFIINPHRIIENDKREAKEV